MNTHVADHYAGSADLLQAIRQRLQSDGKDPAQIGTADLATIDEFHIRGRRATLELAQRMRLTKDDHVLDIGSGLGGPARTLAETCACRVTGIDITREFCEAATGLSEWVGLHEQVEFRHGDATSMPFDDNRFDAAMSIHVAMNIWAKDRVYAEAKRVLKPGGIFTVYDVLQGEGGDVLYPVPWAREPSISHLATPAEMESLLTQAGFGILEINDSTDESQTWFEQMAASMQKAGAPKLNFQIFLGDDFPLMARNQVRNLTERRIRTVTYVCEA